MKPIKLFNGRVQGHARVSDQESFYVGATSIADVVRLVLAAGDYKIDAREVNIYWSKGAWGNAMTGVAPERGVWWTANWHTPPRRLVDSDGNKIA